MPSIGIEDVPEEEHAAERRRAAAHPLLKKVGKRLLAALREGGTQEDWLHADDPKPGMGDDL
jgi:hypothetical protein